MAQAEVLLYQSPLEGASVSLVYDTITLQANHLRVSVDQGARSDLVINWALNGVAQPTITVHRGSSSFNVSLGQTLTGVVTTDPRGEKTINFGITQISFGFSLALAKQ